MLCLVGVALHKVRSRSQSKISCERAIEKRSQFFFQCLQSGNFSRNTSFDEIPA